MTESRDNDTTLDTDLRIDALCLRFERELQASVAVRIEDLLEVVETGLHERLLGELIPIELELRLGRGESPTAAEYIQRFPAHAATIEQALTGTPADPAPRQIGGYKILDTLGEGGMGTVYLVEQREPVRRRAALKVIKLGMDSKQVIARFELERQALAMMSHPAIAKVFEAGITEQGQPYFVMEYVEGIPLTKYCDAHKLALKDRIDLFQAVCRGVQHAHQKGVVHRDLKPGNILVERKGDEHMVKIIDFGLARATDHQLVDRTIYTEKGQLIGTPAYMSPEQASGVALNIDTRTDVYSLGVVLYELLTGELPFTGERLREAGLREIQHILEEVDPEKPSTKISSAGAAASDWAERRRTSVAALRRSLKGDLDWIILRAMAKEPERRYGSALGLAEDLARYLEHEPVEAGPPSASYKLRKILRKYRLQVTAAALVLVVAIGGALVAWMERQKTHVKATELAKKITEFDMLATVRRLQNAKAAAEKLFPAWPGKISALDRWLSVSWKSIEDSKAKIGPLVAALTREQKTIMEETDRYLLIGFLLETFDDLRKGIAEMEKTTVPGVRHRLGWARQVEHLTIRRHAKAWENARSAILEADGVVASTLYGAKHHEDHPIDLKPQMGLVPIGMNPQTKLWEFYHLRSAYDPRTDGDPAVIPIPKHADDGSIEVKDKTGIVFVLLPGGTYTMGAQKDEPTGMNYDPRAELEESPSEQTVAPFFLARHELTQGQWVRLSLAANPSKYAAGYNVPPAPVTLTHPVEQVDWHMSSGLLAKHGLVLPSEVEWEYGCRAGRKTPWSSGAEPANLEGFANIQDATAKKRNPHWSGEFAKFADGHVIHAPVGTYKPNNFGLHDMHGNVWEWCSNLFSPTSNARVPRGGSFDGNAGSARSASRPASSPSVWGNYLGLRPARALAVQAR